MAELAPPPPGRPAATGAIRGVVNRLAARPGFQAWAARFPLTRWTARRDGSALFDLVQGFVQSQVLLALVETRVLHRLGPGPAAPAELAVGSGIAPERMEILMQAGAALGLLRRRRDGRFALARRGAALLGVPGLELMIRHHGAFYRDLGDPVALLRNQTETELAQFWPYVFGAAQAEDPEVAATYSNLMAQSQVMVAQDTLAAVSLDGVRHLMDVGGGTGAFLAEVAAQTAGRTPEMALTLVDLPKVLAAAGPVLAQKGLTERIALAPGSFRDQALPRGADAISLVRVLYDHDDATVTRLLTEAHAALPSGGRLIVSEPMSGGDTPDPATDVYFAFYTLAMGTGRTRSQARIAALCRAAGFAEVTLPRPRRPFVTAVVTARKLG